MQIFRIKSVKIYTSQKIFTRVYPWDPWQIWGMDAASQASREKEWRSQQIGMTLFFGLAILYEFDAGILVQLHILVREDYPEKGNDKLKSLIADRPQITAIVMVSV